MKKKFLSTLLALALCLSLLPTAAFATAFDNVLVPNPVGTSIFEVTLVDTSDSNAQEVTAYFDTAEMLAEFIQSAQTTKIKLLDDIKFTSEEAANCFRHFYGPDMAMVMVFVQITGTLVLDLNGHSLDLGVDIEVAAADTESEYTASLTVMDSSKGQTGSLTSTFLRVGHIENGFIDDDDDRGGALTLSGGTLNGIVLVENGTVRVSGGEVDGKITARYDGTPDEDYPDNNRDVDYEGSVTVTGGKIDTLEIPYGIHFDISGGEIDTLSLGSYVSGSISGGSFGTIRYDKALGAGMGGLTDSVLNYLAGGCAFYQGETVVKALTTSLTNVTVEAHACDFDTTTGWCACGRSTEDMDEADDDAIAFVNYGSVTEYITDAEKLSWLFDDGNGSSFTLKLLDNVTLPAEEDSEADYGDANVQTPVTLDLSGHTLTVHTLHLYSGSLTVMDSSADKEGKLVFEFFRSAPGSSMTLNSGTMEHRDGMYDELGGTMTINGGTDNDSHFFNSNLAIYGQSTDENIMGQLSAEYIMGNDLMVNGGRVEATADDGVAIGTRHDLTVNGGKIKATAGNASAQSYGIIVVGDMIVNGGIVEAKANEAKESCGIVVVGNMIVTGGAVEATSGGAYSFGIDAPALTIKGGTVTAIGVNATVTNGDETDHASYGINSDKLTVTGGTLKVKAGTAVESFDIDAYNFTITGGKVLKAGETTDKAVAVSAAYLYATGGTIHLAAGSKLYQLYVPKTGDFNAILADGCDYYQDKDGTQPLTGSNVAVPDYGETKYLYAGFDNFYVCQRKTSDDLAPVTYLDANGDTKTCGNYTLLDQAYVTGNQADGTLSLPGGWFVVDGTVNVTKLVLDGRETHLILKNDAELKVATSVMGTGYYGSDLTIYQQPAETDQNVGKLTVDRVNTTDVPDGIENFNKLTINGGEVYVVEDTAWSGEGNTCTSVGIGNVNEMVVNGGKVTAIGGKQTIAENESLAEYYVSNCGISVDALTVNGGEVTGIGGAVHANAGDSCGIYVTNGMTVNGGSVTATTADVTVKNVDRCYVNGIYLYSGDLVVSGEDTTVTAHTGKLTAEDVALAAAYGVYLGYGDMTVTNGTVSAGGDTVTATDSGYGCNYGIYLYGGDVTVKGGKVTATGGAAVCRGTGVTYTSSETNKEQAYIDSFSYGIYLYDGALRTEGGEVTATGGSAACDASGVTAEGMAYVYSESYGIVGTLTVQGGKVTATGGNTTLTGRKNASDAYHSQSYAVYGDDITVTGGELTAISGKTSVTNGSSKNFIVSMGVDCNTLTVYGGTVTAKSDKTGTYYNDIYAVRTISVYSGTVQSDANGGAVNVCAGTDAVLENYGMAPTFGLNVKGGTIKLAKGSEFYSLKVSNGKTLADLLDSNCYYASVTTSDYDWNVTTGTKVEDLTGSLEGSFAYDEEAETYTITYYIVKSTSSGGSNGSSGGSSGGGSSSGSTSNTTTNPDGSTTKTEVKSDGTVIETTKNTDGSTTKTETKTETKKDGTTVETVKETVTNANGEVTKSETTKTTKTDENGKASTIEVKKVTAPGGSSSTTTTVTDENGSKTTSNVTVGSKAASDAEKNGEAVELPIGDVTPGNDTTITVDVPKGGATVVIPVENPTPGTVVVIVGKDGSETVIPGSKVTKNGIEITLTEDSTIKVIDNSKDFSDVPAGAYFANAVKWAAARNITGGVTGNTFAPHASCTRAQLVTFLWRAAGQPKAKSTSGMTDVLHGSYYADAVHWAAELGLVGGYGNGLFGVNDTITRQQMAVILYRFAQAMGMDTTQGGMAIREFKDYENISDYAIEAMQWAVNAGILQGNNGNLNPTAPCTRAQIVTMLYRLLG